jgi:hypothetical protein
MKILILITFFISSTVFACRPMMVSCPEKTESFDKERINSLENKVSTYQRLMDKFMVRPDGTHSCFNNHFASFYISSLQEEMKKNEKVCMNYREAITNAVNGLINPDSDENKAVPKKYRGELKKLSQEIKEALKDI